MKQLDLTVSKETYVRCILFTTVLSVILITSWITNMGYVRLIYGMGVLPLAIHITLLFAVNLFSLKYYSLAPSLKKGNWAFYISVLAFHLILPDDDGVHHFVFFGKISLDNSPELFDRLYQVALIVLFVSAVLLLIQLTKIMEIKTDIRLNSPSTEDMVIDELRSNVSNGACAKCILLTSTFVLIIISSWIFNIGATRMMYGLLILLPIIHIVLLYILNYVNLKYYAISKSLKQINLGFNISLLFFHLLLPDRVADYKIVFFGKIYLNEYANGYIVFNILNIISLFLFLLSLVLLIAQIVEIRKIKTELISLYT